MDRVMKSLAVVAALGGSLTVGGEVFPTPQQVEMGEELTRVEKVTVHVRGGEGEQPGDAMWQRVPTDKEGAYALQVRPGELEVWVNDADGLYYAKQTISQLLVGVEGAQDAQRDPFPGKEAGEVAKLGSLPVGSIVDWPDIPYRGVVEGYYGIPWSAEARRSLFAFFGRNKMNTYIYAPKDDPYHHGQGCYQPYPQEKAEEIRNLVQEARKHHVRFVWAIHPSDTVHWAQQNGEEQLGGLCRKMEAMYELGVRDFGVLVDDSSGEISSTERQVTLVNYLVEHFIRKHPEVNQTVVMCPTGYNRSWADVGALHELGEKLAPEVQMMWTGDTVVHDITLPGQRWVNEHVGRPTFVWWNWPCNDFKPGRLSMGRAYGLGTEEEMKRQMSGFVANPMQQAEASKVGLFGVACYAWNITRFDSLGSWEAGIARLYPKHQTAMQIFCNHNSYLLPNNHGYEREESVRLAPVAQQFVKSLEQEKLDTTAAGVLTREYRSMQDAARELQDGEPVLNEEIGPWLRCFELTGKAGQLAVNNLIADYTAAQVEAFFELVYTLTAMRNLERPGWQGNRVVMVKDVEVASYALTPALQCALRQGNEQIYAKLAGRPHVLPLFSSNRGNPAEGTSNLRDGSVRTFWSTEEEQKLGDWFCLDFGAPQDIRRVNLLMGGERAEDYALAGQFEVSDDGERWKPIGRERRGPAATLNLTRTPVRARMVRFRVTRPQKRWISIYDFSVNCVPEPYVISNMAVRPRLSAAIVNEAVAVNRVMEVLTLDPGEFIELEIPGSVRPSFVELNLEEEQIDQWARIELTTEEGEIIRLKGTAEKNRIYVPEPTQEAVRSLRVTNAGDSLRRICITLFRVGISEDVGQGRYGVLTDGDLSTSLDCSDAERRVSIPRTPGTGEAIVVGTAECSIEGAEALPSVSRHLHRFSLPTEAEELHVLIPKQEGKCINEIILK